MRTEEERYRFREALEQACEDLWIKICANRDRYLEAWIAETGLKPSECVLIERHVHEPGGALRVEVTVRKREEGE